MPLHLLKFLHTNQELSKQFTLPIFTPLQIRKCSGRGHFSHLAPKVDHSPQAL